MMKWYWTGFCDTPFWDVNLTVNTADPDLTTCFHDTALTWLPCGFLFLLTPFHFCTLRSRQHSVIRHTWLNVSKTILGVLLAILCVVDMIKKISEHSAGQMLFPASILAPACRFLAVVLTVVFIEFERKKGVRTSGLLCLFWFLLLCSVVVILRSKIRHSILQDTEADQLFYITIFSIFCILIFAELILFFFVDARPAFAALPDDGNNCPEEDASCLSKMTFWWFTGLVVTGYRRALQKSDIWNLNESDRCENIIPRFDREWQKEMAKCQSSVTPKPSQASVHNGKLDMQLTPLQQQQPAADSASHRSYEPRLVKALARTFGGAFILTAMMKLLFDILTFASPLLLKLLISFTRNKDDYVWKGYLYAIMLFVIAFVQSMILHKYFHRCFLIGLRVRTAVIAAVYRKSLKLSNMARQSSTIGEIVNLMSVDAQRFMELTTYLNMIWSGPFQMAVCLYLLWMVLGPSVLAGVTVMVLLIPVNAYVARKTRDLQMSQMQHKDNRIKLMSEILNGIKVLKLYAWELAFQDKVLGIRDDELKVLKKAAYLNAASSFTWSCAPVLVSLTTFAVYVLSSPDNVLDAEKAFVSLSLFNILRFPLAMLPMLIAGIVQTSVSVKRLRTFLKLDELSADNVQRVTSADHAISISNGTFHWGEDEDSSVLEDITMNVHDGSLIAVVGVVGSGKSSLLSAILGEMAKTSGIVTVKGSTAYVAQQAWVQNATLRENILFGKTLNDEILYRKVLEACALLPDLEVLPAADSTEIGEKGINLSGGQKQRVSLARAIYADTDIYLLDDPLSAVDSHVGKHIFDKVLGPDGLLKKKTRVLVTHGISFLPQVDQIIVIANGRISEQGTYAQLLAHHGAFSEFLRSYLVQEANNADEQDPEVASLREEILSLIDDVDVPARRRLDTARSISSSCRMERTSKVGSMTSLRSGPKENGPKENGPKAKIANDGKLIEVEQAETGNVKLGVFFAYIRSVGLVVSCLIILFYTANQTGAVSSNFWLSAWSNDVATNNRTVDARQRNMRLGVYGVLGLVQGVAIYLASFSLAGGAVRASGRLHRSLLARCLRAPGHFFDLTPSGRIMNRFAKDVDVIDTQLSRGIEMAIKCAYNVIGTLTVLAISTPAFLIAAVPLGILYYAVQRFYVASSRQLKRLESVSRSPIYSHFGETLQGVSTIRAYREQLRFIESSDAYVDENQQCYFPGIVANRWLAVRLEFVGNCIVFFSAIFAVIGRAHLSAGIVGLSITYALNVTQTLNWMVRMASELETNIVAVERVMEYSETPTEADWVVESKRPLETWPEHGIVEFRNYSTRYREGLDLVLTDITFDISGGEKIGIVGRTGAGKSSLTLALFRVIEATAGSIFIDGINIAQIGLHDLRSKLTIIPQDPVLFSGTLRMNLDPFFKYSDADVWTALEHAHLKVFVSSLPEQLEHNCTEGGENLSVGQRQLICLARALLRKTKILVLDEATAAVDLETDDLIQSTIRTEFHDSTVITIAHRLNTIMDYNKILVLDNGHVCEFDSPQTLLTNKQGNFFSMAKDAGLVVE